MLTRVLAHSGPFGAKHQWQQFRSNFYKSLNEEQRERWDEVAVKIEAQQASAIAYRTRNLLVRQRVQTINTLRGDLAERVQRRRHAPDDLVADEAGEHEDREVGQELGRGLVAVRHRHRRAGLFRRVGEDEVVGDGASRMRIVITVCDSAAAEPCPWWPGGPVQVHWGYADPSAVAGTDEDRLQAFRRTLIAMRHRLDLLLALPLEGVEMLAMQAHARKLSGEAPS